MENLLRDLHHATTNLEMGAFGIRAGHRLIAWRAAAAALPGMESVALTRPAPLGLATAPPPSRIVGAPGAADVQHSEDYKEVSREFFGVMSVPILRGRAFSGDDAETTPAVAGATPSSVVSLVAREGLKLAAIGLAAGVALSLAATRAMNAFLLGVSPADALTFAAIAVSLAAITLVASYLPARRAARIDPLVALRRE